MIIGGPDNELLNQPRFEEHGVGVISVLEA